MRILHVLNGLSVTRGGPSATLAALVNAQICRDHEVTVLSTIRQPPPLTLEPGQHGKLNVQEIQIDDDSKWFNSKILSAARSLSRNCDIVHIHGSWRYHLRAGARAARDAGIPYIVRPAGNLGIVSAGHKWYLKRPYFFLFERRVFNQAAAIHCTSRSELQQMAPLRLRTRTFVVPNAVVAKRAAATSTDALQAILPKLQPHQKVVLYLGRITWIKRLDVLLEAFIRIHRDFPQWCLIIAGTLEDMNIVQRLRDQAAAQGLSDRVILPGTVLGEAKTALFNRADVFAQPSLHENFGASVAEALSYGIPCAISNGVALAPDVEESGAGIVCESTVAAFADVLKRLMSDEQLREGCRKQALQLAARYQPENVAAQLDVEYDLCRQKCSH